jgi:hypothetical protein
MFAKESTRKADQRLHPGAARAEDDVVGRPRQDDVRAPRGHPLDRYRAAGDEEKAQLRVDQTLKRLLEGAGVALQFLEPRDVRHCQAHGGARHRAGVQRRPLTRR